MVSMGMGNYGRRLVLLHAFYFLFFFLSFPDVPLARHASARGDNVQPRRGGAMEEHAHEPGAFLRRRQAHCRAAGGR